MSDTVVCWKCGESLSSLLTPFNRHDECPACKLDVHVCRMCKFYDARSNNSCREPVAEDVSNKERSNFCDYFKAQPAVYDKERDSAAQKARAELEMLFGSDQKDNDSSGLSDTDKAKIKLDQLFGTDDKD
ncbi:MAG: hypothetical protein GXP19_00615 [Gammaproteobacteria bacterium]|nr:hypothetical protein [Gammaproteobacteria bacterium]